MINRDDFLKSFRELFDETDVEEIQFSTKYKALAEWSSLIVLSLIVQFEDNYETKLTAEDIKNSSTIEDLYQLIK